MLESGWRDSNPHAQRAADFESAMYAVPSHPDSSISLNLEQMTRIELASKAWKASILPLNYICLVGDERIELSTYGL